jgi:hypothetical protein
MRATQRPVREPRAPESLTPLPPECRGSERQTKSRDEGLAVAGTGGTLRLPRRVLLVIGSKIPPDEKKIPG